MYALEIENLNFGYGTKNILKNVSFQVEEGEFISIIGPNGSGKSTLLKLLNNIYEPKSGTILIQGREIQDYKGKELARKVALVPQNTVIDYEFSVEDVVLMGRYPYLGRFEKEGPEDYSIVDEALKLTNTFYLKKRSINEISGGERQRVVVAKTLAQKPDIILLDEPTSHLDINHQIEILRLLKRLNRKHGTTIILVIHDINLANRYSDRILLLDKGQVLGIGKPSQVVNSYNIEKAYNLKVVVEKNKITDSIQITPL
ncbi:ABC transporter ATP-binding protein [Clostridium sp. Cult3]|uniref:ABC transporter ATP-binding protein n=1 Tax=Clostridium sp. Cult3 TaxID=2079004 RepID=UPI001F3AF441|nr:ABC transporter ATP-binding protein [Clostridium sp. Cult3]MCF6460924.1 ABC transporter [Clostridium sp. Cult3]